MSQTINSPALEKELLPNKGTDNFESLNSVLDAQSPILLHSGWQN
ncbi:MAG: hypothetical protein V7L20_31595 [Nostoc sp.]